MYQFLLSSLVACLVAHRVLGAEEKPFSKCATQMVTFVDCVNKADKFTPMELSPDYEKLSADCFEKNKCTAPKNSDDITEVLPNKEEREIFKTGQKWYDALEPKQRKCMFDAWTGDAENQLDICFKTITANEDTKPLWPQTSGSLIGVSKEDFVKAVNYRTHVSYLLQNTCVAQNRYKVRTCLDENRRTKPVIPDREKCLKETDATAESCVNDFRQIQILTCKCVAEKQRQLKVKLTKTVVSWSNGKDTGKDLVKMTTCTGGTAPNFIKEHEAGKGTQVNKPWSKEMAELVAAYIFAEHQNYQERFCHHT